MIKKLIYLTLNLFLVSFNNEIIKSLSRKKKITVIDIGCFRGVFSLSLAKNSLLKKIKKKFYLLDPNPSVKKYLNLKNNKYSKFIFNNIAISKNNKQRTLYLNTSFESSGTSLNKKIFFSDKKWNLSRNLFLKFFFQKTEGFKKIIVKSNTLDSFINKNKLKKIDILKIDVEGGEEEVIFGMKNSLKKNYFDFIQLEISSTKKNYLKKSKKINLYFLRNNYKLINTKTILSVSIFSNIKCTENLYKLIK